MTLCIDRLNGEEIERRTLDVSEEDADRFDMLPRESALTTVVFDATKGEYLALGWDDCGARCRCAAQAWTL